MNIIDFTKEWLPAAYALVMANYQEERNTVHCLPEHPSLPPLEYLAENGLSVAAVENGKLLGFLGAYGPWEPVFYTRNLRGVFSPLHAHAVQKENRILIWQRLYQSAGRKWVRAGAASHAITLYAHDIEAQTAMYQYGFGLRCMDLIRPLEATALPSPDNCTFSELPAHRTGELRKLRSALSAHLEESPCFMVDTPEDMQHWLNKRDKEPPRMFAAEQRGRIIGYMELKEEGENFAVSGPETWNICGAYFLPEFRGGGIAHGLLEYMSDALRSEGCTLLGVDCESFNPTALRFWTKHFTPYTHSVVRRIDDNAFIR